MKIKDKTSYSQRDTKKKARVLEFMEEKTGLYYTVHRHIDYPGTWLVSCKGHLDRVDLKTDDLFEAAVRAKKIITSTLIKEIHEMQEAVYLINASSFGLKEAILEELGDKI